MLNVRAWLCEYCVLLEYCMFSPPSSYWHLLIVTLGQKTVKDNLFNIRSSLPLRWPGEECFTEDTQCLFALSGRQRLILCLKADVDGVMEGGAERRSGADVMRRDGERTVMVMEEAAGLRWWEERKTLVEPQQSLISLVYHFFFCFYISFNPSFHFTQWVLHFIPMSVWFVDICSY